MPPEGGDTTGPSHPRPRLRVVAPATGPCQRCGVDPVSDHKRVRAVDLSGKAYRGALLLGAAFLESVADTYERGLSTRTPTTEQATIHYPPQPDPVHVEQAFVVSRRRFP